MEESSARLRPWTKMAPDVGRPSPAKRLSRVDLPEPELPRRATNSPPASERETSLTARTVESPRRYSRVTLCADRRGPSMGHFHLCPSPGRLPFGNGSLAAAARRAG